MVPGAVTPPAHLIESLKSRYSEAQRHYHTWVHIDALLGHLRRHLDLVHSRTSVLWAILWHDAIYDPRRHDNEEMSASLLRTDAQSFLEEADLYLAEAFVRSTAGHDVPAGLSADAARDCGAFLDFDLSILAAPEPVFDAYEAQIRLEYQHVPEDQFRMGRSAVLKKFQERAKLYFTPKLARLWEQAARANLARSIARLSG